MNTDVVIGVSDRATDTLLTLFNTDEGRRYLVERRGVGAGVWSQPSTTSASRASATSSRRSRPPSISTSGLTTSCSPSPPTARRCTAAKCARRSCAYFGNRFDAVSAGETWGRSLAAAGVDHVLELSHIDRKRIFNLGYFTWVEQQGVSLDGFPGALASSRSGTACWISRRRGTR